MIIYPLQWLAVIFIPKQIVERTGHPNDFKQDRKGKICGNLTQLVWILASLYSIFLPFQTGTVWLYTGLGVFTIGLIILILATITVAKAVVDKPFTKSIYRFSRHPMYLSMIFVYLAVSIATASWLFILITIITFFLLRFQAMQEEKYCSVKYGQAYQDYMDRTPRWIGIPKTR